MRRVGVPPETRLRCREFGAYSLETIRGVLLILWYQAR